MWHQIFQSNMNNFSTDHFDFAGAFDSWSPIGKGLKTVFLKVNFLSIIFFYVLLFLHYKSVKCFF